MVTPANEARIKELEKQMQLSDKRIKENAKGKYNSAIHSEEMHKYQEAEYELKGIKEADANAEKFYNNYGEIKQVHRKQGWISAIEWVKEQMNVCLGEGTKSKLGYKKLLKILDTHSQDRVYTPEGISGDVPRAEGSSPSLDTQTPPETSSRSHQGENIPICKKCNDECDCHMFIGGSGKPCSNCKENSK